MVIEARSQLEDLQAGENLQEEPVAGQVRDARGRILPGHTLNPNGRIKAKPRVLDRTKELAERRAKRIARAWVSTMEQESAAGNRARADYRDTFHGVPKQTLVLQQGDDPLALLLPRLLGGSDDVIEGEHKLLDTAG